MREHVKYLRDINDVIEGMLDFLANSYDDLYTLGAHLIKNGQNDPKVSHLIPNISNSLLDIGTSLVSLSMITDDMRERETTDG